MSYLILYDRGYEFPEGYEIIPREGVTPWPHNKIAKMLLRNKIVVVEEETRISVSKR